ncbi:hypothetical protein [Paenibacillus xylanexedens]|uniref:hypothetical protein n=1 Tax=Paenibacillus xylanexedens TaxID=528191 RepID=UPI00119FE020|nr:hypothetical protein [Paenibacillus xylanexedens]
MTLHFETFDRRGICADDTIFHDSTPFFDLTLEYPDLQDMYIPLTEDDLDDRRSPALHLARDGKKFRSLKMFAYAGAPLWPRTSPARIITYLEAVLRFNRRHPDAAFDGICLDIQPFELGEGDALYQQDIETYLDYLSRAYHLLHLHNALRLQHIELRIATPHGLHHLERELQTVDDVLYYFSCWNRFKANSSRVISPNYTN